jgi:hypothetical protein
MQRRYPWDDLDDGLRERLDRGAAEGRAGDDRLTACNECGRPIGPKGGWYADESGVLLPYCASCAEVEFPVL